MPQPLVLIVDDNPENLTVIGELLQAHCALRVARSGARALQLAHRAPAPDLILLDVMMPGMDGFEVLRQLRADPATARLKVVFLSALTEPADVARGRQLGALDYVTKPIDPKQLLDWLHPHLVAARPAPPGPPPAAGLRRAWGQLVELAGVLGLDLDALVPGFAADGGALGSAREAWRLAAGAVHEHWDGSGYPDGLAGDAIPVLARLWAVVGALDMPSLADDGGPLRSTDRALQGIVAGRASRYDPQVVDALLSSLQALPLTPAAAAAGVRVGRG